MTEDAAVEYKVVIEEQALKELKKMDGSVRKLILAYIESRLVGCKDPRVFGKGLTGERSGQWRYRVGNYRILTNIDDEKITIYIFKIGHRSNIYSN